MAALVNLPYRKDFKVPQMVCLLRDTGQTLAKGSLSWLPIENEENLQQVHDAIHLE